MALYNCRLQDLVASLSGVSLKNTVKVMHELGRLGLLVSTVDISKVTDRTPSQLDWHMCNDEKRRVEEARNVCGKKE